MTSSSSNGGIPTDTTTNYTENHSSCNTTNTLLRRRRRPDNGGNNNDINDNNDHQEGTILKDDGDVPFHPNPAVNHNSHNKNSNINNHNHNASTSTNTGFKHDTTPVVAFWWSLALFSSLAIVLLLFGKADVLPPEQQSSPVELFLLANSNAKTATTVGEVAATAATTRPNNLLFRVRQWVKERQQRKQQRRQQRKKRQQQEQQRQQGAPLLKRTEDNPSNSDSSKSLSSPQRQQQQHFPNAFTSPPILNMHEQQVLQDFSQQVLLSIVSEPPDQRLLQDWHSRTAHVAWGGGSDVDAPFLEWWDVARTTTKRYHRHEGDFGPANDFLDRLEGGHLLYSYHRIMKHLPAIASSSSSSSSSLLQRVHFPIRMCGTKKEGCLPAVVIEHTLQWREIYQPWKVDPSVLKENANGWIYTRGFSKSSKDRTTTTAASAAHGVDYGRHAILWARPGAIDKSQDGLAYVRSILHSADLAVAKSLHASIGRVGKFNAVIDVRGYEWGRGQLPALSFLKQAVTMLQDHFPDRLGVVLLVNLSRTAELVVNLIKPWLTKEVRDKIHTVHSDQLHMLIEPNDIPSWLGGPDEYQFDVHAYYSSSNYPFDSHKHNRNHKQQHHHHFFSEKDARAFVTLMPYHAH